MPLWAAPWGDYFLDFRIAIKVDLHQEEPLSAAPSFRTRISSSWSKSSLLVGFKMPVFLATTAFFLPCSFCEFHFFTSDQWLRSAGGSLDMFFVLQTLFPFLFSVSVHRELHLAQTLWYRGSLPSFRGQGSLVSSACACVGRFLLHLPPKLATEKMGFSPVGWSLAAIPNNYLCFQNFFSAPETFSLVWFFSVCTICAYSLLFCYSFPPTPPPPPHHFVF